MEKSWQKLFFIRFQQQWANSHTSSLKKVEVSVTKTCLGVSWGRHQPFFNQSINAEVKSLCVKLFFFAGISFLHHIKTKSKWCSVAWWLQWSTSYLRTSTLAASNFRRDPWDLTKCTYCLTENTYIFSHQDLILTQTLHLAQLVTVVWAPSGQPSAPELLQCEHHNQGIILTEDDDDERHWAVVITNHSLGFDFFRECAQLGMSESKHKLQTLWEKAMLSEN